MKSLKFQAALILSLFFSALGYAHADTTALDPSNELLSLCPSGPRVVLLYDDFLQSSLDTNKWQEDYTQTQAGKVWVSGGELVAGGGSPNVRTKYSYGGRGTRFEFRGKIAFNSVTYVGIGVSSALTGGYYFVHAWPATDGTLRLARGVDTPNWNLTTFSPSANAEQYYVFAIDYGSDGVVRYYVDGVYVGQTTTPVEGEVYFFVSGAPSGKENRLDWVRISRCP